jgi:hypothetical protein
MIVTSHKKKQTSWDRLKSNPMRLENYQKWRREYNLRRKGKVNFRKSEESRVGIRYHGVVYNNIADMILNTDLKDREIIEIWKSLKASLEHGDE